MYGIVNKILKVGAVKFVSIPIILLTSVLLARWLGPELFGKYSFVMAILPLLSLPISGGLPQLLVRQISFYLHHKKADKLKGMVYFSFIWSIVFSFVIICITYFIASFIIDDIDKLNLLKVAVWFIPALAFIAISTGILQGLNEPVFANIIQQLLLPLLILFSIVGLYYSSHLTPYNIFVSQTLVGIFCAGLIFKVLAKKFPAEANAEKASYQQKVWFASLLPFSLLALANTFNTQIGVIILGVYSSDEAVAGLRIAERGVLFVGIPLSIINSVAAPYIVNLYELNDINKLQTFAKNIARVSVAISFPVVLLFFFFGEELIEFVFGLEYVALSYWPLVILSLGQLFNVFCGSVGHLLSMTGHANVTLKGQLLALCFSFVICAVFVPFYGAIGAAVGVTAGVVIWNLLLLYSVKKILKINACAI